MHYRIPATACCETWRRSSTPQRLRPSRAHISEAIGNSSYLLVQITPHVFLEELLNLRGTQIITPELGLQIISTFLVPTTARLSFSLFGLLPRMVLAPMGSLLLLFWHFFVWY